MTSINGLFTETTEPTTPTAANTTTTLPPTTKGQPVTPHHQHVKHLWTQSRHNPTNTTGEGNNMSDKTRHQTLAVLTILTHLNTPNVTVETREAFTIITHETPTVLHQIFVSNIDGDIYPVQDIKPNPNTLIAILNNETNG